MHIKTLQKKGFVEKVCPAIMALFMFRTITLKQFDNLTAITTFNLLGGQEVTLQTAVQEVPGSIPGSGKDFYVCSFV